MAVSLWNLQPSEERRDYQATLIVKVPGKPDVPFAMNFSHEADRCRAVQGVLGISVDGPGEIKFEVRLNGIHAATHTVKIHALGARDTPAAGEQL
jgi:hypothetical protein